MYQLKSVVRRVILLIPTVGLIGAVGYQAILPALSAADALNPLTERTLLLSSSSPGWAYTDGSGNATYAPPDSGANGLKTGETFSFKPSTDSTVGGAPTVKAFTFQFCTTAAGDCYAPGDDLSDPGGVDDSSHADLNVVTSSPAEVSSGNWSTISASASQVPPADDSEGNFVVLLNGAYSGGWSMAASNLEDTATTGKHNYITLTNTTAITPTAGEPIKVIFFGTNGNYITNPGEGAFFVKINDYSSSDYQNFRDAYPLAANDCDAGHTTYDLGGGTTTCNQDVIDGGVTVANVMNQSIEIQTKVLETMEFSVGTIDPDTEAVSHGPCDAITTSTDNAITLGNPTAENSLAVGQAYDAFSYWRLSSNSSNGATVYYSGNTLANTEGNQIGQIYNLAGGHTAGDGSAGYSHPGSEQFGLGIDSSYADNVALDSGWTSDVTAHSADPAWHAVQLAPLSPSGNYGLANGAIVTDSGPQFAFNANANTVPTPIASENSQVVNCSTGQMRYIGNIAATTAAGIYTTAINYLAAPEY